MKPPSIRSLFAIILLLATLGQMSSDLYLPSLPAIAKGLNATSEFAKLTLAIYMLGFAVSQLIYGPLSDGWGRRKPLLIGLVVTLGGAVLCAFAPTIELLIVGRLIQGLGAGCGLSVSRSMMRDLFVGKKLARLSSFLGVAMIGILASAPVIGGYLQEYFDWRANFYFLLAYTGTISLIVFFRCPETNIHLHPERLKLTYLIKAVHTLVTSRLFVGCTMAVFFTHGAILGWLTVAPILLQEGMGLSPVQFGWLGVIIGGSFAVGGTINALLVHKVGVQKMLYTGASVMTLSGVLMLILYFLNFRSPTSVVLPISLFILGTGGIYPNAFAGALSPFAKMAGLSAAIFGFMQLGGGYVESNIFASIPTNNQLPISLALIISSLLVCASVLFIGDRISEEHLQDH